MRFEACILAGGLSERMGRDKARLRLGGTPLLDHVRAKAERLNLPARVIDSDAVPRCGPLGGIVTALRTTRCSAVLFLSCDMPFVSVRLMRAVMEAVDAGVDAALVGSGERLGFPLVFRRRVLKQAEEAIGRGELSLRELAGKLRIRRVDPAENERLELLNINTPEDLRRARALWRRSKPGRGARVTKKAAAKTGARRAPPTLEVSGLYIRRGRDVILGDVNWRVEKGENWAVMGANGSGKTSLLGALTGYFTPSAGEISVLGRVYGETDLRDLRKRIGLVTSSIRQMMADSEPALETVISGKDAVIDYWGKATLADTRRARRILGQIGCSELEARPWAYLSQGERQRVLIGRALMARPRLLILDEPCAGLDPAAREHFLQFLERIARGRSAPALVLVTHHVEEITPAFSHVLVLSKGATLAAGPKARVLKNDVLSAAFQAKCEVRSNRGRYHLAVADAEQKVF